MRRPIHTRAAAAQVAQRIERDAIALWGAVRHDGISPIRDDEVAPINGLRRSARDVARLLRRRGMTGRKNH